MGSPRATSSAHTLDDDELPEYEGIDHLLILYATETGNSQDVAERLGREVRRRGGRCVLMSMDTFDVFELIDVPLVVFITSTHGNGDPPPAMMPLWTALLRKGLPADILEGVNFALYGLGDSSYDRFAYAGKLLHRRLLDLGANPLNEPVFGDERAPDGLEETLVPWMRDTVDVVLPHLAPPPEEFEEIAASDLPPPLYRIEYLDDVKDGALGHHVNGTNASNGANGTDTSSTDGLKVATDDISPGLEDSLETLRINESGETNGKGTLINGAVSAAPTREADALHGVGGVWKPDDWQWATLRRNERVTREDWWQEVREFDFELDDRSTPYAPASIANLQPASLPSEVDEFLSSQDLLDEADRPFRISSAMTDQPLPLHLPPAGQTTTLRRLLTYHLDMRGSPRKSFFEWLRRLSGDERERERLDEFVADPDEVHDYATRPSRTILETLADFRHTRIPLSHILEILPPLRRRQFSIASSWHSHPGQVQLLVAIVEYRTNLKTPRRGLCSSWLKSLANGTKVAIKISRPMLCLPKSKDTPVVLVGPGTGVAPLRAMMEERIRQGAGHNTILYFGCRSLSADAYFLASHPTWLASGARVRIAASRDTPDKVYVQDLIKQDAALIREWLYERKGWLFVCGSSGAMPKAVRDAVAWCLTTEGGKTVEGLGREEADEWVGRMFEEGRGGEESW